MSLTEKLGFLKGVADCAALDVEGNGEGKVLKAIIDLLDELVVRVEDLEQGLDVVSEQVDSVDEDLAELESFLYEDCDCEDCCGDEEFYEVECPNCGETIAVNEEMFYEGSTNCPKCDSLLEFDIECESFDEDEQEDDD